MIENGVTAQVILSFFISALVLVSLPGPSNALVMSVGIVHGRKAGVVTVPAVAFGYVFSAGVILGGLGPLLQSYPTLALAIRWGCAAYLIYTSYKIWSSASIDWANITNGQSLKSLGRDAFIVTLLNPKALVLTLSFVPTYFPSQEGDYRVILIVLGTIAIAASVSTWCYSGLGGLLVQGQNARKRRVLFLRGSAVVVFLFAFWLASRS